MSGLLVMTLACQGRPHLTVFDGVPLADADHVQPLPEGPRVKVGEGAEAAIPEIPAGAEQVQVLAHRAATWGQVRATLAAVEKAGARPILVVAAKGKPMMLTHSEAAVEDSILLAVEMPDEVKACVSPPGAEERVCSARPDGKHVDRAFVREIIRQAVKQYGLTAVHVRPEAQLEWADVVRAVDGARTCCGAKQTITVSVEDATL